MGWSDGFNLLWNSVLIQRWVYMYTGLPVRYAHLKELILSFLMVFILSQLDIYIEKVVVI